MSKPRAKFLPLLLHAQVIFIALAESQKMVVGCLLTLI